MKDLDGAIRVGDWKLVLNGNIGSNEMDETESGKASANGTARVELFNLAADPYEKQDLAAKQQEKVVELRARYDKLAAEALPPKAKPRPADFKAPKVWGEQERH